MSHSSVYDLAPVDLPRLGGFALRLMVALADNPLTRWLLLPRLLASAGLNELRQLKFPEPITFLPVGPASDPGGGYTAPDLNGVATLPSTPAGQFRFWSVRDFCTAYGAGHTTPETVAERVLDAIAASDRLDPPMRMFIAVDRDDVMRQAHASTERWQAGQPLGPFDGVPVAVKDEIDMLPYPTTIGTRFGKVAPTEDATIVARLRAAGAMLLGKTNLHEFEILPSGLNPHYGAVRNPYEPTRDSGGSSSGSGATVAAGLCPVALGADGGGSIRIPAAFCGVVGLKPTFGRIPRGGSHALSSSIGFVGPIAASAEDAALAYAVMAGPDALDEPSLRQPSVRVDDLDRRGLSGLRLGIFGEWFTDASPDIVRTCEVLVGHLAGQGAEVIDIQIPDLRACYLAHTVIALAEISVFAELNREHWKEFARVSRLPLALSRATTANDYLQAARMRTRVIRHFEDALSRVDAIVTPSTGITAPRYPEHLLSEGQSNLSQIVEVMRFINPGNLTGHPAISIPAGYDASGLPIGLHFTGRYWGEQLLLRLAYAAAPLVKLRKPRVWFDVLGAS